MRSEARSEKSALGQARRKVVLRVFFMVRRGDLLPRSWGRGPGGGPQCRGAACGFIRLRRARPGRTRRAFSQPLLVGVYTAGSGSGPPHAPTPPHGEGSASTHVPQCITLHLQSARLIASRFLGERHVRRLPGQEEAGRGRAGWGRRDLQRESDGSADNGPIQRRSAQPTGSPAQKTQTNKGAPASGAAPGSGSPPLHRAARGAAQREAWG